MMMMMMMMMTHFNKQTKDENNTNKEGEERQQTRNNKQRAISSWKTKTAATRGRSNPPPQNDIKQKAKQEPPERHVLKSQLVAATLCSQLATPNTHPSPSQVCNPTLAGSVTKPCPANKVSAPSIRDHMLKFEGHRSCTHF